MNREKQEIKRYQRFKGYDYSRGATLFVTIATDPRRSLFGRVQGNAVELNDLGRQVDEALVFAAAHTQGIRLHSRVVMPDHIHFRVYIEKGLPEPLKSFGCFVRSFKTWTTRCWKLQAGLALQEPGRLATGGGLESRAPRGGLWQQGCHDRICLTQEIWERVDRYIAYNPLKWSLMHGDAPPLKVHELLDKPLIPPDELWSGVGCVDLLEGQTKVCVLQLSRRIPEAEYEPILNYLRCVAKAGFIFASTFISPLERKLLALLEKSRMPIIHAVPDELQMVYRPKGEEPRLFAEDRYLMLSRLAVPGMSRAEAWHSLNAALGAMAEQYNGRFLYIRSLADCR